MSNSIVFEGFPVKDVSRWQYPDLKQVMLKSLNEKSTATLIISSTASL